MNTLSSFKNEEVSKYSAAHNGRPDYSSMKRKTDTEAFRDLAPEAQLTLEVQLKCILESTADGIFAVDCNGKVIQTNRRFAELWAIPEPLLDRADEMGILDFAQTQLSDPEAFLNKVRALHGSADESMDVLRFKDGRIVKRYSSPLILDGAVLGRVWSFHDITKRTRAEEGLRGAEEQFRSLVEQALTGIIIIQDRRFAYVNPRFCEIHGYALQDELIGTDPLALIAEKDRGATVDMFRRLLDGEVEKISHSLTALRKDGTTVEIGVSSSRFNYRGRPAVVSLTQDISQKIRIEADNLRYVEQIKIAFMSTVEVVTIINQMRDPYTANHARRAAEIAVAIAVELGLDARFQEGLHIAGHLHDIGKINIPTEILSKPGKLGAIEFQLVKTHAQAGFDILKGVEFPWPVAQIGLQHHERMDGSGYPQGLKGEAILPEARIMAVADVVEAMASHRPYRAALGIEVALTEIERGRGTMYDADAADACLCMLREERYQLPI
jgi:PAS domain S-box-containing protein